jgi:molecular chaperone DnaK
LIEQFKKDNGIDLNNDRQALQRLKEASEKAKIELSTVMQTEINLPYLTADASGPKHLVMTMSRAKLEQITADLVDRTIAPVKQALSDAGLNAGNIDEIVLVGGMTRMPAIQDRVRAFFGKDPHKGVNPDEVVAIGAAIQAGVLGGEVKDILLLDVTPLTLSIETLGGVATAQIERNTTIPTRRSQVFSTASDNQTQVEIHVLQGERPMASDNKSLGKFILDGIPPAPRGVPQVEVTFDVDANGILKVSAKDKATGRTQHITITASSGLSDTEVEKMRKDAEAHADEDRKRKELIEARNNADNMAYAAEKAIREFGDKVPVEVRSDIETKVAETKSAAMGEDIEKIKAATDVLGLAIQKIGASVYEQGSPAGTSQASGSGEAGSGPNPDPNAGPDVVDGEVKE